MPYVRIWVHAVFSTKNRIPYLKKNMRKRLWNHIRENCKTKNNFEKCQWLNRARSLFDKLTQHTEYFRSDELDQRGVVLLD